MSERDPLITPHQPVEEDVAQSTPLQDENHDKANQVVGSTRATLIIVSLWVLIFFQAGNMSGLTTTQSTIASDLNVYEGVTWFTSTYLIAMSSIAPLAGKLSQIFPPRNLVLASSILFGTGGLVTSQARTFSTFLIGRALSGVGGAGILTISIILVLELTSKRQRGVFIGLVNAGYTTGVALGAVIAGGLLERVGWRPMFWIQTPLAIMAGVSVYLSIPASFSSGDGSKKDEKLSTKLASIDYIGALLLSSTIILFLYGLSSSKIQWSAVILSLILLPLFVLNEIYSASNPIIPITVLSSRGTLFTCLAQLAFMASRWTVLFYTPVYAIAVKGWAPAAAGSVLVPTNVGFALGGLSVGWLHINRAGDFYTPCLLTFGLFASTLLTIAYTTLSTTPAPAFLALVLINGAMTGAAINYSLAQVLHLSPPSVHFIATSLLATFRGFAGSFGSAIGGGIFSRVLRQSLERGFKMLDGTGREDLVKRLVGSPALVRELVGLEKEVAVKGYEDALRRLYLAATVSALVALAIQCAAGNRAGKEVEVQNGGSENED